MVLLKLLTALRHLRLLGISLAAAALCGCGGGDSGGDPPEQPPAPAPRLQVTATLNVTGPTDGLGVNRSHAFSFQNASQTIHVSTAFSTSGIQNVTHVTSASGGTLNIQFRPTAALSPGNYTDTITLYACLESPCVNNIEGSPRTISVTYTVPVQQPPPVTGPTLILSRTSVDVEAMPYTAAPVGEVQISIVSLTGSEPVVVGGSYTSNGIHPPSLAPLGTGRLSLSIPFRDPASLPAGTYTDTILIRACLETPCVNHIAGSPQAITIRYVIVPNPAPPSVTFSATTLNVTYDNVGSQGTRLDESIRFSVSNLPAGVRGIRTTVTGTAVLAASGHWNPESQGVLGITLRGPGSLPAGTYSGRVQAEVCSDAACEAPLPGSPGVIDVTYVVTGNSLPNTQVTWASSTIRDANLVTSETRTPRIELRLQTNNFPPDGLYVRHTPSATGLITGGVGPGPTHVSASPATINIELTPPARLGSGIFTDSMSFEACFDAECSHVVPASAFTLTPRMFVMATEGVEYTRRTFSAGAGNTSGIVWSPADGYLYMAGGAFNAPKILQIDPRTMDVVNSTNLTTEGGYRLAVTEDGSYLYVGSMAGPVVQRLQLPALVPDLAVNLGELNSFTPHASADLLPLPGQPRSFIVQVRVARTGADAGVRIYDDDTMRPVTIGLSAPEVYRPWLLPASTPGQFISQRRGISVASSALDRFSVDGDGVRIDSSIELPPDLQIGVYPLRAGSKLYHHLGTVLDADSGEVVGEWTLPGTSSALAVVPDERNRRLIIWTQILGTPCLVTYDLDTLQPLAYAPAPFGGSGSLLLWGDDGVALVSGGSLLVYSGTLFSTYRGEPTQ